MTPELKKRKYYFAGNYYGFPQVYPQGVDKLDETVRWYRDAGNREP
jgi:hypothetical protein